jgi:2-methylisocitrate lyase-like PEP mutase family enzyme
MVLPWRHDPAGKVCAVCTACARYFAGKTPLKSTADEVSMSRSIAEKRADFHALHKEGCFIIPNPWDVGSSRMLQHLGFAALATTSTGLAWAMGRPDYAMDRDAVLTHLRSICEAVDLPVSADFESGFASDPDALAANVRLAIDAGVAGLSIEDRDVVDVSRLYHMDFSVERVRAAREAIDQSGKDIILVARTETLLVEPEAISAAIDKLVALADAGADCLFAPGVHKEDDIVAMVKALSPKPVNVVAMDGKFSMRQLADMGVRRISVGGSLARVAWGAAYVAANDMRQGSFTRFTEAMPGRYINHMFGPFA